jgi:DNA repair photolyase
MALVPPIIHEIQARSALNAVEGMPFKWSLNPYKGCRHACSYCYARAYHQFLDLAPSSFENQLFVKTNVAEVLRAELRRPSWRGESVAIGTATDPYQPLESQYRLTRGCLEAFAEVDNPISITTKGTLVRRDVDILADMASRTEVVVNVSLISLDAELLRKLEPGAPAPARRLETIERLSAAGVPVSVFLAPILPGITDDPTALKNLVRAAAEHGASDAWTGALRLADGVRDHFMQFLEEELPGMVPVYSELYGGRAYLPTGFQIRLEAEVGAARRAAHMTDSIPPLVAAAHSRRGQLNLPI